jgi:hypothetical protein
MTIFPTLFPTHMDKIQGKKGKVKENGKAEKPLNKGF